MWRHADTPITIPRETFDSSAFERHLEKNLQAREDAGKNVVILEISMGSAVTRSQLESWKEIREKARVMLEWEEFELLQEKHNVYTN